MSVWELRRCPACGYEAKPRRRRPDRAMELACHVCKDEMVTVALTETTATADPSRCEDPLAEMLEAVLRRLEYSRDLRRAGPGDRLGATGRGETHHRRAAGDPGMSPSVSARLHRWVWRRFGRRLAPCVCRGPYPILGIHSVECPRYWSRYCG